MINNYNKILIKVHDDKKFDDYYIEVVIGGTLRLSKEELNKLAEILWNYSWRVEGTFLAENRKYFQNWVFELPSSANIGQAAEDLLQYLDPIFPNKVAMYE